MAEKKNDTGFKVSDRRPFTAEGELRPITEESEKASEGSTVAAPGKAEASSAGILDGSEPAAARRAEDMPTPPAAAEQEAQHQAYKQSTRDLDSRVELSGHSAKDLEVTFERFLASLYMTAMLQLGLMHEQGGQPTVDLIGARQTIDTLGMLAEKTKGNLSSKEQGFLQNSLYELRMAYVEVTNALARGPQAPGPGTGTKG
jgi:hypothetical protein